MSSKKTIIIILLSNIVYSNIFSLDYKINKSLDSILFQTSSKIDQENSPINELNKNNSTIKAMLYSGFFPGLGQNYLGSRNKAILFASIEVISISTWSYYQSKGNKEKIKYKDFANENWSFSNWISDYYNWYDYDNQYRYAFINYSDSTTGCAQDPTLSHCYPELWDGSHSVSFTWEHDEYIRYINTNDKDVFPEVYMDIFCGNFYHNGCNLNVEEIDSLINLYNINIVKDHHFYENIGKYDPFFSGWIDNDSIYVYEKQTSGEFLAMSKNKNKYRDIWENANQKYYKVATYALSAIMANHVGSMLDALLSSKLNNIDISLRPLYEPLNEYGIGAIQLEVYW